MRSKTDCRRKWRRTLYTRLNVDHAAESMLGKRCDKLESGRRSTWTQSEWASAQDQPSLSMRIAINKSTRSTGPPFRLLIERGERQKGRSGRHSTFRWGNRRWTGTEVSSGAKSGTPYSPKRLELTFESSSCWDIIIIKFLLVHQQEEMWLRTYICFNTWVYTCLNTSRRSHLNVVITHRTVVVTVD